MKTKELKAQREAFHELFKLLQEKNKKLQSDRDQLSMTLELLDKGGFIKAGKLEDARKFCESFINSESARGEQYGHQSPLIGKGRNNLLTAYKQASKEEMEKKSDLDWIFSNAKEVLEMQNPCSIIALAKCFGLNDLWGARPKGFEFWVKLAPTLDLARPFLEKGDKAGWLDYCKSEAGMIGYAQL